jgi:ribonuclease Z
MEERYFLIDCGEGTQSALRKNKVGFKKIDNIFISHLHGDHYFGLIGLLSTLSLLDRKKDLHVYSPKGLKEIIVTQFRISKTHLSYFVHFHEISSKEPVVVLDDKKLTVKAIPLKHRIEAYGFLFEEKLKERKLNIDAVQKLGVEVCDYRNIKLGKDYEKDNGEIIDNSVLTFDPPKALSYAYCSDTAYYPKIANWIKGVNLLYHESTFIEENAELANKTGHSTAKQAALIAEKAEVGNLLLGHFSARYKDRNVFLEEAKPYFDKTDLASESKEISFKN